MADKRISQLIERVTIANNDVLPIVASGATTTNKVTVSTLQDWMQNNLDVGVTSIGITIGSSGTDINVTGSPVTTSGNITINIPTASATNRGLLSSSDWTTFNNKLSSVGLSMPSAFTVSNSPLTANGTITVTGAGTVAQYIRGDGSLADFPEAGGGGASVSYYLNGSVSQGTIGGIAYYEMNKTPILGAGTDFTIAADGYIASFITDAGDPSLIEIPGGNWNFESYFQASSGGGSPSFYIELYKVNSGGTATLIASNSANPELIAFGTTTTAYFSTLAVPTTTLALTDRLAVRFYVTHSGRTITMHTENSNLCQVITTFTTGLTALNGLTAQVQNFATGTSGTDFAISSAGSTHTFNLPDASATARGVVTTGSQTIAGIKTFSSNMNADGGVRLPASGTALPTFVNNISGSGLSSSGSNGFGFNNANNFYFSGSDKGGSVFVVNNTATRNYTFQDTSGVIALTSNIPTNPVGGSGTINQIPKYTSSTTTIGNSNISDNGSDVVIASRTGISLSGQSILITPNLGGTTNRIETTGGLPLALVTSGSSITLAAGGTTPQITLESTGAVTLTGALNGTSASFNTTNAITLTASDSRIRGGDNTGRLLLANSGTSTYGIFYGSSHATLPNAIQFVNDNTTSLTLSSTGAATFSSTLQAGGEITTGSVSRAFLRQTAGGDAELGCKTGGSTTIFSNGTASLTIATSGAATFSSSVTATRFNLASGSFSNSAFWGSILTAGSGSFSNFALLDSATNGIMYNPIGTLNMVFTGSVNLGSNSNAADSALLNIKQAGASYNQGIYIERGGERNGYHMYIGGALDSLTFRRNYFGTQSDVMSLTRDGNVGIGTASPNRLTEIVSSSGGVLGISTSANSSSILYGRIAMYSTAGSNSYIDYGGEIRSYSGAGIDQSDLRFYTAGGSTSTERMRITSGGAVSIGATSTNGRLGVRGTTNDSSAYAFEAANSSGNSLFLVRNDGFVGVGAVPAARLEVKQGGSEIPMIIDSSSDSFGAYTQYQVNNSGGWEVGMSRAADGYKYLFSYGEFGTTNTKVAITNTGDFIVGKASFVSNSLRIDANGILSNSRGGTGTNSHCNFFNDNGLVGSITTSGSSTSYNTSSDYRLKENVKPVENALSVLTQLKPCTFNFIADADEEVMGFIAHEVQEVIPQAVIGQKDEVRIEQVEVSPAELDEEGNVITEAVIEEKEVPVYQGIDHSKLVPLLVAAIQEQQEQIKSLTEQVEALKSQING